MGEGPDGGSVAVGRIGNVMGGRGRKVMAVAAAAAALGAGAAVAVTRGGDGNPSPVQGDATRAVLTAYNSCDQLLGDLKARALEQVGPDGFAPQGGRGLISVPSAAPSAAGFASSGAAQPAAAAATPAGAGADSTHSATNDQEVGVDEPDVAKTDGRLLVAVRHSPQGVQVVDVGGATPVLEGFVATPQVSSPQLFLTGTDAVVVGQGQWTASSPGPASEVVIVSLSDPRNPTVVRSFSLQGAESAARLIAGRVVVVLQGQPSLPFVYPSGGSDAARAAAEDQNRAAVQRSTLSDWLPSVTVTPGGRTYTGGCQDTLHAAADPGTGTVSVVSIDPARAEPGAELTVVGRSTAVYASPTGLYVAAPAAPAAPTPGAMGGPMAGPAAGASAPVFPPGPAAAPSVTDIHAFDLSDPDHPRYVGSGAVPGTLLGQYSMSEYQGDLRVATTVGVPTPAPGEGSTPAEESDSRVTVLALRSGALTAVGRVGGLGRGEKIYGVRFVGPLGYVVTFRQTDPLYVVDLSDPARPALDGQLPLTGYSSFLQPLGGNLLLGVGQAVGDSMRPSGLQLSVFDLADPGSPRLAARTVLAGAASAAQNDPHALLWWPDRRLVAAPVNAPGANGAPFAGLVVWQVGADGSLREVARLSQPAAPGAAGCACPPGSTCACPMIAAPAPAMVMAPYAPGVERAVVVGSVLYTVSDSGIMATDMDTWAEAAWLRYAPAS